MSVALSLLEIILWLFLIAVILEIFMIVCWFALSIIFVFIDVWKEHQKNTKQL